MKKQKQKTRMFFKDIMQDNKGESKQFKTATGSPILYTRLRKHRGIYYPLAKHHTNSSKNKPKQNPKHVCVVYSKIYGREVYGNVDIWPDDEIAREKLLQKLQAMADEEDEEEDDVGIDIPKGIEDMSDNTNNNQPEIIFKSTESCLHTKPPDEKRHVTIIVTDTSEESSPSSGEQQIHPAPTSTGSPPPPEGEGEWPLKRSQSVNSRDNPFLPGGNLSKEADEILSKATIIRDRFTLDLENANKEKRQNEKKNDTTSASPPDDKSSNGKNCVSHTPVNENMIKSEVMNNESAVVQNASPKKAKHKENGQVETENSLTPGSVTLDLPDDGTDKKKQKKCCAIM